MSDAAATLHLKIETGNAATELRTLKDAYALLKAELAKGVGAVGGAAELVQSMKTAQAETERLKTSVSSLAITYSAAYKQGRVSAREALEGMTKDQVIELSKQQTNAREASAKAKIQQQRDIEQYREAAAERSRISDIQQKRDIDQYREAAADHSRISDIQQKRDIEKHAEGAAELLRVTKIQQQRDIEQYRAYVAEKQSIAMLQQKRDMEMLESKVAADKAAAAWASKSQAEQLRAALPAARALAGGTNASLIHSEGAVALAQQLGSAEAVEGALKKLNTTTTGLSSATKTATEHQKHWNNAANEAHALARGLSGSLGTLWMTYGSIAPLLAGAAMGAGFVQAAKQGSEFSYQLTFVKALSGETAAAIDMLSNSAIKLSTNGLYGPTEIASGYRILAQAGLDATKALEAMPNVLNLATVGEMNMEQAATTLVGVMTAFNLTTKDSEHVGDVFAKAAALSQTSVQQMTEAMKTASVVGEQYGASLEDTATALTLLAKVNITGTAAGTSFRNMLKELYTPVPQAAAAIKKLGLETQDAMGNMRSFPDIIYDLKTKLQDFDKASQTQILQRIFGERGAKEAIMMLSMTKDAWVDLRKSVTESEGFMKKVADELENTAKGSWAAALNTMKSQLVMAFQSMEPAFVDLANSFKSLFSDPAFTASLTAIVGGLLELTSTVVKAAPALLLLGEAWLALKVAVIGGGLLSALAGLGTSLAVITAESALAGGGLVGLRAGLIATSSTAAVAAGATGLGGLAPALALLAGPAGWLMLTAAALATVGTAMYLFRDRTSEAMMDSSRKVTEFAQEAIDQLSKVREAMGAQAAAAGLAQLKGPEAALTAIEQRITDAKEKLAAEYNIKTDSQAWEQAYGKTVASKEREAAQAYVIMLNERGKLNTSYQTLKVQLTNQAEADAKAIEDAKPKPGPRRTAAEILGKDPKAGGAGGANDAYAAQMTALQNFVTGYENEYKQFTSDTQKMQNEGHVSELQMIQMNGSARITSITNQMEKEQAAIALAKSKGKLGDVESHKGKLAALDADRIRAATDTDNKLLEAKSKFSDEMLKLDIAYNGRAETELMKAGTQLKGKWSELMNKALLDGNEEAQQALAKMAKNLLISADFKDQFNKVKLQVSDFTSEISALEADIGRDGGWMARILGTEAIYEQIEKAKVQISSQMEELRAKLSLMNPGDEAYSSVIKQFTQLRREYDKVANYVPQVWKDITKSIDGTIHEAFSKIFTKGKTDWKAFGRSISDSLKTQLLDALYQVTVRKWVFNIVANVAGGAGWTGLASSAAQIAGGGSGAGGSGSLMDGASLLSLGSNAWNLYKGGTGGVAGYGVSALGSLTGNLSTQAYGAGMQMTASQASTAAALYTQAANAATTASTNLTLAATAAEAEGQVALAAYLKAQAAEKVAEGVAAKSTGAGLTSGSSAASTVAWVVAIVMAMKMSNDAYKAGIRWDGTYDFTNDPLKAGPSGPHHERQSQVATAVFGKDFANSEFFATVSGNALSQMVHNLAWGGQITTGVPDMAGTFSEAGQGFTGGKTGQEITEHGGWFTSTKRWWEWKDISSELDKQMDVMYFVISDAFLSFGDLFQDSTMLDKVKGFSLNVRTASNGDTFSVIREQLTSSLGNLLFPAISEIKASAASSVTSLQSEMDQATKLGNTTLATSLKAQIDALSTKVSESWSTTFTRVTQETTSVSTIFAIMGKSLVGVFGQNNANTILKFSDNVVTAFGGIEAMNTAFSTYLTAFMTPAEQLQASISGLGGQFTALDTAMPKTIIGFKALVDGIDFTKAGAADLFKGLIALVPAFTQVSESFYASLTQGPSFGLTDREKAYNSAFDTPAQTASKNIEFLNSTIAGLGLTVPATKDAFVALRNGLDRTKDSGEYAYQVLTSIGPLFASIGTAVADAAVDLVAASTSLSKYLSTERNRTNILTQIKTVAATAGVPLGDESLVNLSHATASDFATFIASIDTGTAAGAKMFGLMADIAPLFENLFEIQSAALQTQADAIITTYGDVVSAMAEINPPAKTLVDSWRENKTTLEGLQSVFNQFFGQSLPDAGANIQALLTQMDAFKNGASTARSNADNARLQGMTPAERASFWRTQEASLWQGLGNSTDKAGTISKIMEAYGNTRSAELEALTADQTKLNDTTKTGLQTQLEAWQTTLSVIERAKSFAKDLEQFMGSLAFSDLSALNYNDQLAAAGTLYSTTLAGAQSGDVNAMGNYTGNAQSYLEEARAMFGSGLEYANIYAKVTGDASGLGIGLNQDGTQAQSEIDRLTTAISGLTTTIPTAFAQETSAGYIRIADALTPGVDYTKNQMNEQKALLQKQIAQQQEIIANQQAQIAQQAALHAELMAQQAAQTARLTSLESNTTLAGAGA